MERRLREKLPGGRFENVDPKHARRMSAIRGKGTKTTERRFRAILVRAGLRGWKLHPKGVPGRPDVFFPGEKLAVFLDGCFWHGCPACGHVPSINRTFWRAKIERNRERDVEKEQALVEAGYIVLRFWEHDIQRSSAECLARVLTQLGNCRGGS